MVYQDNTSSILLERNGRRSSTKRTKHMDIRYFYVTEQVGRKTIHVTHCPTEEMVGDFFTKPLQGSLFLKMRNYIMGNEEPGYQDLPRIVLRKYDSDDDAIRKQKIIGIRSMIRKHQRITTMRPRIQKVQLRMFPQGTFREQNPLRISKTKDMRDVTMITINNVVTKAWWLNHDLITMWW